MVSVKMEQLESLSLNKKLPVIESWPFMWSSYFTHADMGLLGIFAGSVYARACVSVCDRYCSIL